MKAMEHVRKISQEFSYLDSYEDTAKLLIVIGLILTAGIPLLIIGILTVATFV